MTYSPRLLTTLCLVTLVLTFIVIVLGAYTRLSNAGLGCPDWPGCYGQLMPSASEQALKAYPDVPFDARKAWIEMIHRYVAGTLGLFILAIAIVSLALKKNYLNAYRTTMPYWLVLLVIFQGLLGMWTVTLKLHPFVVMGHLLGGMLLFAGLVYTYSRLRQQTPSATPHRNTASYQRWTAVGIAILFIQIALGGWVSANYAAVACIGFPLCNGQLWPSMYFHAAFNFFSPLGINYEFGVLDHPTRVAIQMTHRIGAMITLAYIGILTLWIMLTNTSQRSKLIASSVLCLLLVQFILGIINVVAVLPLPNAVAHNATAALLLGAMVLLYNQLSYDRYQPH